MHPLTFAGRSVRVRPTGVRPAKLLPKDVLPKDVRPLVCAIGSGPRYQILSHVFARGVSQKKHGHARIARETRVRLALVRPALSRSHVETQKCIFIGKGIIDAGKLPFYYEKTPKIVRWEATPKRKQSDNAENAENVKPEKKNELKTA